MKPIDVDLVHELADENSVHTLITMIEQGSIGGFGDHLLQFSLPSTTSSMKASSHFDQRLVFPDTYFETTTQYKQQAELNSEHIRGTILRLTPRGLMSWFWRKHIRIAHYAWRSMTICKFP
jgi:deoxyxylulose-5-phosphate synthase